jgi:hypothetical protein
MIDSKYYSSKYYDKYGDIFKELEFLAYEMGKEWDTYIKMYDEMDIILHKYLSLRYMHGTDLKLYALMYRNVDIGSCSIVDKSFFLSKANEISGYRNTIFSNKASNKEKLVRYYFEYEFLFEMFFRNITGADMLPLSQNESITLESYQIIKDKKFNHIPGINDLSDQTCSVLLSNLNKLESSINDDKYFVNSIKRYDNFVDFIKEVAFPYYFGPHRVHEECFQKYSRDYCNNETFEIIQSKCYDHLCQLYSQIIRGKYSWNYTNPVIDTLKREKVDLESSSKELFKLKHGLSSSIIGHISFPFFANVIFPGESDEERNARIEYQRKKEEQRKLELERARREEEREREKKIAKLEKEVELDQQRINKINRQISMIQSQKWDEIVKEYEEFVINISEIWLEDSQNVWKHMFEHQDYLQNHISTFYKTRYVYLKKNQTADKILEKMKSVRGRSITDFVTLMSDPLRKERAEKGFERGLDLSAQENVCVNQRAARQWANEIKKIINEKEEKERIIREEEERKRRETEEKRLEQYRFNMRNKHWRDDNIFFRKADHLYIVDGTPLDSVTTFVKNCFPEFDSEFHAKRKAEALGITKEAVLGMWDEKGRESREQGTAMHEKIESYYLGKSVSTDTTFELFKIFAKKITLKPYRTEWTVYDWEQKIAGTIDFVDYQNGEYIIYDWKRSDKLIAKNGLPIKNSQYGVKALPPIENLDDSPYYHYALQLSLYKYILEKNYGITVSKLRLGIFHPSYNKPYILEIPYLQNEIDTLFSLKSEVIF